MSDYDQRWPKLNLDIRTLDGAYEAGSSLWLIGSFGGFGGAFYFIHGNRDKAIAHREEINKDEASSHFVQLYELSIKHIP